MRRRFAVARKQAFEILAVGEIKSAAAGHQELAPDRRHSIVNRDGDAVRRQHIGRHQSGRTAADNRHVATRYGRAGLLVAHGDTRATVMPS
jgi:hypothetical protein